MNRIEHQLAEKDNIIAEQNSTIAEQNSTIAEASRLHRKTRSSTAQNQ